MSDTCRRCHGSRKILVDDPHYFGGKFVRCPDCADQPTTPDAVADVISERERQDVKWGVQNHALTAWIPILGEEFGELCQAVLNCDTFTTPDGGDRNEWLANAREEAVQCSAVALAIVQCIDRNGGVK